MPPAMDSVPALSRAHFDLSAAALRASTSEASTTHLTFASYVRSLHHLTASLRSLILPTAKLGMWDMNFSARPMRSLWVSVFTSGTSSLMSECVAFQLWRRPLSSMRSVALAGGFHRISAGTVMP